MERDKKNTLNVKRKKGTASETEQENLLQQVLKLLEFLFQCRLVQKISRPIDKKVRQEQIDRYGIKLEQLHEKLIKIQNQIVQMNFTDGNNPRNKSVFGQATSKPGDWRKAIRSIQSKYIEVLIDGSYKFFNKICNALQLEASRNMELINIEEWAVACLDSKPAGLCC